MVGKAILAATLAMMTVFAAVPTTQAEVRGDIFACVGALVRISVGHDVEVYGSQLGVKSGIARAPNPDGDTGLFIYDKTEGTNRIYTMSGWSPKATCLGGPPQSILEYFTCVEAQPTEAWIAWASDVEARLEELQTQGNPVPPCSVPDV